jgi:DNA primase small subunit
MFLLLLQVNLGDKSKKGDDLPHPLHPMMSRAYEILEPMFVESVLPESGHGMLASQDKWEALLDTLPSGAEAVKEKMMAKWGARDDFSTPAEKWHLLQQHLDVFTGKNKNAKSKMAKNLSSKERALVENWPVQVVFKYTYPRLDINVSKMKNHLLKSPFCVHPKTGRVCVPIQVATVDDFDPFEVPTLPRLMKELDEYDQAEKEKDSAGRSSSKAKEDWQKTSLKEYFEPFQKEFLDPLLKELRREDRDAAEEQAAMTGDF